MTTAVRVWVWSWVMQPSCQDVPMIIAAADGSALGNPGPAGWAWYVDDGCWASGGWPHGTNNMGELMAVLDLLQQTAHLDERAARLLRQQVRHRLHHEVDEGLEAQGLEEGRRQAGDERRADEGARRGDGGTPGQRRYVWVKGHAGHRSTRPPTCGPTLPRRPTATAGARPGPRLRRQRRRPPGGDRRPGRGGARPVLRPRRGGAAPTDEEHVVAMERALLATRCARTGRRSPRCCTRTGRRSAARGGSGPVSDPRRDRTDRPRGPRGGLDRPAGPRHDPAALARHGGRTHDVRSTCGCAPADQWQARFHQGTDEA